MDAQETPEALSHAMEGTGVITGASAHEHIANGSIDYTPPLHLRFRHACALLNLSRAVNSGYNPAVVDPVGDSSW